MHGFHAGGLQKGGVIQQNGLGEAGGAGGIIDGGVVGVLNEYLGGGGGAVGHQLIVAFREGGLVVAHEEQVHFPADLGEDVLHPADEFRAEEQHVGVG